jgi:hypothetical protein
MRLKIGLFTWLMCIVTAGAQDMHDHGAAPAANGEFNPWVVSDGTTGFYIAYVQRTGASSNVMFEHHAGSSASAPVRVNDRPGDGAVRNENPPKIAVGPGGEIYVVWANEKERWKGDIRFARSLDGGRTFTRAITVNSPAGLEPAGRAFESIAIDAKGRILIAWIDERNKTDSSRGAEIWMATSEDRGVTFSRDHRILANICECCRTTLATDSAGRIYISYRLVPATGPMFRDIAVARSEDGGKTFRSSIVHHDGLELAACPIAGAAMTIDHADRIHVVWFTEYEGEPSLLYAMSNNGQSFSAPQPIDPGHVLAKHAHIVALPGNQLLAAWDDVSEGHPLVKWGLLDTSHPAKMLGSAAGGSFPVIAANGRNVEVVALASDGIHILRRNLLLAF